MAASSSKGTTIYISKGSVTPASVTITDVTAAKPSVVTVSAVAGITAGDVVQIFGTGVSKLDGKYFIVGAINAAAKTFPLIGADTTGVTIPTLTASASAKIYKASDTISLCLSTLGLNSDTPGTVSVGTFCDPSATIPAVVTQAGTITLGGYVDVADAGYTELLAAETDGLARVLNIVLPGSRGSILAEITVSGVAFDVPIDGAIAFTATAVLASKAVHRF